MKPLQCPYLFFNPSLTYFNGKENEATIDSIKKQGVLITEEITQFQRRESR